MSGELSRHRSDYAELHCLSNFTFLRGASHAEELVAQAKELGYAALAITDECSLAGVVRAHAAVKKTGGDQTHHRRGVPARVRAALRGAGAQPAGYARLSRLITRGRRAAEKGSYALTRADVEELSAMRPCRATVKRAAGTLALWLPPLDAGSTGQGEWMAQTFAGRAWIAVELMRDGRDRERLATCRALGATHGLPLTAAGDVHMHVRERRRLQDALTAVRHGVTLRAGRHAPASQWRTPPARARAARAALSTRVAGRNREDRRARELLAR